MYNPTLPYHSPTDAWNPTDGEVQVQTYVDTLLKVRFRETLHAMLSFRKVALKAEPCICMCWAMGDADARMLPHCKA